MDEVKLLPHEFTGRMVNGERICKWCSGTPRECSFVFGPLCNKRPTLVTGQLEEGWQPIESAPKDGTLVDLWASSKNFTGRYPNCEWGKLGKGSRQDRPDEYDWLYDGWSMSSSADPCDITHWRPLPDPPAQPGPSQ